LIAKIRKENFGRGYFADGNPDKHMDFEYEGES
jgi:hypothetical protein